MIIAIDFDGVIVRDAYPAIGRPLIDMQDVMRLLFQHGHILIINTCRTGKHAEEAKYTLDKMNVSYHLFNQNHPERITEYDLESRKISADLYLDDKNLGGFPGWSIVYDEVLDK